MLLPGRQAGRQPVQTCGEKRTGREILLAAVPSPPPPQTGFKSYFGFILRTIGRFKILFQGTAPPPPGGASKQEGLHPTSLDLYGPQAASLCRGRRRRRKHFTLYKAPC